MSLILVISILIFHTTRPLHAYAYKVDSMLAIELRKWLAKLLETKVVVFDIMGHGN